MYVLVWYMAKRFVIFRDSDYGVLAVGLLHYPLIGLERENAATFTDTF